MLSRRILALGGAVATLAGLQTVLTGARSIPGRQSLADPLIESELRYYAAYYSVFGVAMLAAAARDQKEPASVRPFAAGLMFAGLARANAWRSAGRPDPKQLALLAIELGAPPIAVALESRRG